MDTLKVQLHNIKNIKEASIELPFDNGIYTFVGTNGCSKSTLMLCLAQLLSNQLQRLASSDTKSDSFVKFETNEKFCIWKRSNNDLKWKQSNILKYNGLYEGSLFYGTRFEDSTNIEKMIESGQISY